MFSSSEISKIFKTNLNSQVALKEVHHVAVDSRLVFYPESTLFFCLPGLRVNGHDFIPELYQKGVRHFVVSENVSADNYKEAAFYKVDNGLNALQSLAKAHRSRIRAKVIAVTGSNGKTIVKEWLSFLLQQEVKIFRSPASYNSQIGVALSILAISEEDEIAIIEAGISTTGEMKRLEEMIAPDFGILTNIGSAHDSGFENRKEKLNQKFLLFTKCSSVITGLRSKELKEIEIMENGMLLSTTDQHIKVESSPPGSSLYINGDDIKVEIPFQDEASIQNASICLLVITQWFSEHITAVLPRFSALRPVTMRGEVKEGVSQNIIVSDYYNSDLQSFKNILDLADQSNPNLSKTLILSDFEELGDHARIVNEVAKLLSEREFDEILLVGQDLKELDQKLKQNTKVFHFASTQELIAAMPKFSWRRRMIVLKGARRFEFERIASRLVRPVFGTRLEIDLEALLHNWQMVSNQVGPEQRKMVMVKAQAYGSGLKDMAQFYEEHGADYLGVAHAHEGVELRESGLRLPIMILHSESSAIATMVRYYLEPVIYSFWQLSNFIKDWNNNKILPIHLNVNTGMNRLGFRPDEIGHCLALIKEHSDKFLVKSVMTHLSSADEQNLDGFTLKQLKVFDRVKLEVESTLQNPVFFHAHNSAGLTRFGDKTYDMVRLGIILYGIDPGMVMAHQLRPVHRYISYISQISRIKPGERIGYGAIDAMPEGGIMATVPVGYADGLPRSLGEGVGYMVVRSQKAKIVGRVCMDMTMIDVSGIDGVNEGDEVEIFGNELSIEEFSSNAGTIPYEILSRISSRVIRVFTKS